MKRKLTIFVLIISLPLLVQAYVSPGMPTGYVNDFAGVLTSVEKQSLENKLSALEKQTGDQVAVVTVKSLGGDTVENYAVELFREWGIGSEKNDNGLLILVAIDDREVRIEVGYGLEGTVTDLQSGNIIRNVMTPAFKKADYFGGIEGAVDAITSIILGSADAAQYSEPASSDASPINIDWSWVIFPAIILLNVFGRILGRTKSWWLGGLLGAMIGTFIGIIFGFFFAGIIGVVTLTVLGLIFDFLASKHGGPGSHPPFWLGGMGGGKGGSSGGFGGFGGGMSGGGGASGRW